MDTKLLFTSLETATNVNLEWFRRCMFIKVHVKIAFLYIYPT
jgi:hypothetical protein